MKTAQEYMNCHEPNWEYPSYYHESSIEAMINDARIEAIRECAEEANNWIPNGDKISDGILKLIDQVK